jgi:hypothetical protein
VPDYPHRRFPAPALLLALALACLGLAACGGSSNTTKSATSAASTTAAGGQLRGRFTALRSCLAKAGITLPQRALGAGAPGGQAGGTPGGAGGPGGGAQRSQPRPGGGFFGGGGGRGLRLPNGVTRAKLQAALMKCGGSALRRPFFNSANLRATVTKFAACMRQNGVKLPTPNTSGNGPVFNNKGLNTAAAQFMAATAKCRPLLTGSFGGRGGGPGGPPVPGPGGAAGSAPGAAPPAAGVPQT